MKGTKVKSKSKEKTNKILAILTLCTLFITTIIIAQFIVIDNNVNIYAENNLSDIWEKFDKLRQYVIDVIKRNNKFNDSDSFILGMAMDVSLNVSDQVGFDIVFSNQYDNEIF